MVLRNNRTTAAQRKEAYIANVGMSTIRARMEDGLSFDDALECILQRRVAKRCVVNGIIYPSPFAAAKDQGVMKPANIYRQMHVNGLEIEEAINAELERDRGRQV